MISSTFLNIMVVGVVVVIGLMYQEKNTNDLIYVESTKDGRKYMVRNLPDKEKAANMMSKIRENLVTVKEYLNKNKSSDERTGLINAKFRPDNMRETEKGSKHTSYSVNKGEKLVFCLRSKNEDENLVDMNTMMFVALHEMAHIMTKSIGHTPEFWKNFKYLLKIAVKLGLYKEVDYSTTPQKYCGMTVSDTPLTDPTI